MCIIEILQREIWPEQEEINEKKCAKVSWILSRNRLLYTPISNISWWNPRWQPLILFLRSRLMQTRAFLKCFYEWAFKQLWTWMKMSFPANWAAPFSIAHARDCVVKLLNDELGFGIMAHRRPFGNVACGRSFTVVVWTLWGFLRDLIAFCPFCVTLVARCTTGHFGLASLAFVSNSELVSAVSVLGSAGGCIAEQKEAFLRSLNRVVHLSQLEMKRWNWSNLSFGLRADTLCCPLWGLIQGRMGLL